MGLGSFIEKKLVGTPQEREQRKAINVEADKARMEGYRKGKIERARKEGYAQGKGTGRSGPLGGVSIDPLGGFGSGGGSFDIFGAPRTHAKKSSSSSSRRSGTTIRAGGVTVTVHGRGKAKRHRRRDESPFLF